MTSESAYHHFTQVDIRVGTVLAAEPFPKARKPAWKLSIDLGDEIGVKRSSAQITALYTPQDLVGRQVMCAVNLGPRQIGPFISEVLTLGVADENGAIVLLQPERPVPNGQKMF
ncbi:tRNA-binding protein [Acetobacter sp. TBRC 12305]|uniref:tRNA-binding protein n=1 Tax=Acetobacter garciniae TaxID=2817435 RepID=A0A939KQ23_9PROT|nr:tRNA-binding protein [Acetobacter garciniae]MBO1324717.1 tRNA-binding protein [Acetobacter garciniae]MBX0344408.1 tRNA-binding protein [Acetobacter garciniae]